jgi:hypothetical protein
MKPKQQVSKPSKGTNESKVVKGNLGDHAADMATFKGHVGTAVTDLQQVAADMGAYNLNNVHLAEVVKYAIHELNKAYGHKQGT